MRRAAFLFIIMFASFLYGFGQFSVNADLGMNLNVPKRNLVASSVSPSIGVSFDYNFGKFFTRAGVEQNAFALNNGGEIALVSLPLYIGTVFKKENFWQITGFGYYYGFPNRFIGIDEQNFKIHGFTVFNEFRYEISGRSFVGIGFNMKTDLASQGTFDLYNRFNFYMTFGMRFGKK